MTKSTFHAASMEWSPLPDGSVEVIRRGISGNLILREVIDPSSWASIVAQVSAGGESGNRFQVVEAFHKDSRPMFTYP